MTFAEVTVGMRITVFGGDNLLLKNGTVYKVTAKTASGVKLVQELYYNDDSHPIEVPIGFDSGNLVDVTSLVLSSYTSLIPDAEDCEQFATPMARIYLCPLLQATPISRCMADMVGELVIQTATGDGLYVLAEDGEFCLSVGGYLSDSKLFTMYVYPYREAVQPMAEIVKRCNTYFEEDTELAEKFFEVQGVR